MEVTIKVVSAGRVIERIRRVVRLEKGMPSVTYLGRLWQVVDGCIQIDEGQVTRVGNQPEWALLVHNLLSLPLPDKKDACSKVLQECFRECLAPAVVQAVISLSALGLEQQARALLVDVLKDHRDAQRLYKLLRMQLLFRERSNRTEPAAAEPHSEVNAPLQTDLAWEWAPSEDELEPPDVDDKSLRLAAASVQESIGAYRAVESGMEIPGLDEVADETAGLQVAPVPEEKRSAAEIKLLERTARLGPAAVSLLSYFADNPRDKALHAEAVLGLPAAEVRRLLQGSLRPYLRCASSAGVECHPWVREVLSALEGNK